MCLNHITIKIRSRKMSEFEKDVIDMLRQFEQNAKQQGRELATTVDNIMFRRAPEDMIVYNAAQKIYPVFIAAKLGPRYN